jgi:hypothetical protein
VPGAEVVARAAVAQAEVEIAVRAEDDISAVMVELGLVNGEQDPLAGGVGGSVLADGELGETAGVIESGRRSFAERPAVADVDFLVLGELGMKRKTERPALVGSPTIRRSASRYGADASVSFYSSTICRSTSTRRHTRT